MYTNIKTEILATGLTFPEGPRWHKGELWFSDFFSETVYRLDKDNALTEVVHVPGQPSGLGWNRADELLVVSMIQQKLLRYDGESLHEVADLSNIATGKCNDMLVTEAGDCYIGDCGFEIRVEAPREAVLIRVTPDGEVSIAADHIQFPNGCVLIDEGKTMLLAETWGGCLTAFTVNPDGSLSDRRIWADLGFLTPDGISVDALGGVWVATPRARQIMRVESGGRITHRVPLEQDSFACAVGGDNCEGLYICTSNKTKEENPANRWGRIEYLDLTKIL